MQFAKWKGANVTATACTANIDYVKSIGAETGIDYTKTKFENAVRDIDVVLETVGGDYMERSLPVLKKGGMLAVFDQMDAATETVSAIIAEGIIPAALEMIDDTAMDAVHPIMRDPFPAGHAAVLLIEVEGVRETVAEDLLAVGAVCRRMGGASGPHHVWLLASWRLSHNGDMDRTTIPIPPELLARFRTMAAERRMSIAALIREALEERPAGTGPSSRVWGAVIREQPIQRGGPRTNGRSLKHGADLRHECAVRVA